LGLVWDWFGVGLGSVWDRSGVGLGSIWGGKTESESPGMAGKIFAHYVGVYVPPLPCPNMYIFFVGGWGGRGEGGTTYIPHIYHVWALLGRLSISPTTTLMGVH
jgi:hypothetical protein